jgi:hypothetical protein
MVSVRRGLWLEKSVFEKEKKIKNFTEFCAWHIGEKFRKAL